MLKILKLCCSLFIIFSLIVSAPVVAEDIRIALRAHKGAQKGLEKWQATADYLTSKVSGYRFILVPFEINSALNQAVSQGKFHFCITNPASAVEHSLLYSSQPLATLVNKRQGKGYSKFGSVIFTRSDRKDINRLSDLKEKVFMGVDELGFGGWRVAWHELLENKINPYSDFKEVRFAGGKQQNVVYAVRDGLVDAGSVRTDMLERMAASGKIKLHNFKVLGLKKSEGFPFLRSTKLYPEWLFSASRKMDDKFKTQVIKALFSIKQDDLAARKGKYNGWISPLNYSPVENLLKELKVGPYNIAKMSYAERIINEYGNILFASIVAILLLSFTLVYMMRLNNRIISTQKSLKNEVIIRKRAEFVLSSLAQQSLDSSKKKSFFNDCLINLADLFDAKFAFIGLFANSEKTKIRTYAVLADNDFVDNFEYELEGTPCQDILNLDEELIGKNASVKYPGDELLVQMNIDSYLGAPLISPSGLMMGLVSVMDIKPMAPDKNIQPILKIFANRIALEMQRKQEEEDLHVMTQQLSYQASHDVLTGLVNRREFEIRLKHALDTATNNNEQHGLCYLDLDQFKVVNDTCGHLAGDELLKQLSVILNKVIRGSDTLARLGGDEFGILFLDCPMERAEELANILLNTIREFRFVWENNVFEIGASVGLVPIDSTSLDIYELLQAADSACYVAKDMGRNRIHIYKKDDIAVASHQGEMRWVTEITRALDEGDFILYRQKIQSLDTSKPTVEHYEFLIRMKDDKGNIIMPGSFIKAAERYNLMFSIDRWVIENSFSFVNHHYPQNNSLNNILYAINLSGLSIDNERLPEFIESMIEKYNISPQTICFEITETAAIKNFSQAIKFIENMKQKGFRFALDDFGTGLCSYAYLRNLPINYLKIDGRFVRGLIGDSMNRAIIESIVHIAKVMQVYTIAEWVEDENVYLELKDMGVDFVQGYHIGIPEEVPAMN